MEVEGHLELQHLHDIEARVMEMESRHFPHFQQQKQHLLASLCGGKWFLSVHFGDLTRNHDLQKKIRCEAGAFEYKAKEHSEYLTRYLCELDNILSFGNQDVKEKRKALVLKIQDMLVIADEMKLQAYKVKQLAENMIQFAESLEQKKMKQQQQQQSQAQEMKDVEQEATTATATDMDMTVDAPMSMTGVATEELQDEMEQDSEGDSEEDSDDEEEEEEEEEEQQQQENTSIRMETEQEEEEDEESEQPQSPMPINLRTLPAWKPYYQIHKRSDGLYMTVNLRGADPENIRVQCSPSGVLKVSGYKLPTEKDLILTRMSGKPTFGYFEISHRFPRQMINFDHASQQVLADGTLEVHLPYYLVQHPGFFRSMFPARRNTGMVW